MGQRNFRRLLFTGAIAVIRWALRRGAPGNPWLPRLLERKPPMVAAFALANKMARGIWAMLTRNEDYRDAVGDCTKLAAVTSCVSPPADRPSLRAFRRRLWFVRW